MKIPQKPPSLPELLSATDPKRLAAVLELSRSTEVSKKYLHWDKQRHLSPPVGFTPKEWWLAEKLRRSGSMKAVPLVDKNGAHFHFAVPDHVQAALHRIDIGAGGSVGAPEPITNPQTRDRYLIRSLMEEAITSSQLEGAVTTREVAKEMIRTGRSPRDTSERMILNNFLTMRHISELDDQPLSRSIVLDVHRRVTDRTLEDTTAAGRFRRPGENVVVSDEYGEVFHQPPPASELETRLDAMCDFANAKTPDYFVHPVIRAIILHFWLAYDHPFVDGNGRTARALFYWSMLRARYWLFEFISISHILRKAPVAYARSFLYTETDDNDLTYFVVAQAKVINSAIDALHAYIDRKATELRELETQLRALEQFNHRQVALIRHALRHPHQVYTIASHRSSHGVAYQTARTDLLDLAERGVLHQAKQGKKMVFSVPANLGTRLGRRPVR